MAMDMANAAGPSERLAALQQENAELREQLRRAAAERQVARGAIHDAVQEKEIAARLAHQVTVEERATRTAVEVQGSSVGLSITLQVINFLLLLTLLVGVFFWLPGELETHLRPATQIVTPAGTGTTTTIIPGR